MLQTQADTLFRLTIVAMAAVSMTVNLVCFMLVLHRRVAAIRIFQAAVALYIGCFYGAIITGHMTFNSDAAIAIIRSALAMLLLAGTLEALLQTRKRKTDDRWILFTHENKSSDEEPKTDG